MGVDLSISVISFCMLLGWGVVGVVSTGEPPGTIFLSFSKNGRRIPKGEAGVVAAGTGVLSLSTAGMDGLATDVSILGGLGALAGILSGACSGGN